MPQLHLFASWRTLALVGLESGDIVVYHTVIQPIQVRWCEERRRGEAEQSLFVKSAEWNQSGAMLGGPESGSGASKRHVLHGSPERRRTLDSSDSILTQGSHKDSAPLATGGERRGTFRCSLRRLGALCNPKVREGGLLWRKQDGPLQVEMFLVSSVAAILAIRAALFATGYPKLGGGGIHIAHMLWGGLMMFAAQLLLMLCFGRRTERVAAILGGLGFGTFIDELGKFVTEDNDYFFRPTPVILYIIFCVLFVGLKLIEPHYEPSRFDENESLGNSLQLLSVYASTGLTKETQLLILDLLTEHEGSHPLVSWIVEYVQDPLAMAPQTSSNHRQQPYLAFRTYMAKKYELVVTHRYTIYMINSFFIFLCAVQMMDLLYYTTLSSYINLEQDLVLSANPKPKLKPKMDSQDWYSSSRTILYLREFASGFFLDDETKISSFEKKSQLLLMSVTAFCVARGVCFLSANLSCRRNQLQGESSRENRMSAFIWFRRSMILRLLVTDALLINHSFFWAFCEVSFTLFVIGALTFMLVQETTSRRERRLSQSSMLELGNSIS